MEKAAAEINQVINDLQKLINDISLVSAARSYDLILTKLPKSARLIRVEGEE